MKKYLELRSIAPGQNLYHYTKRRSLKNILQTETLFATKSSFLNDTNEMEYIMYVATEVIKSEIPQEDWQNLLLRQVVNTMDECKRDDTFVLSFSCDRDSITLWSEFGDQTGYNVAFDGQQLIDRIRKRQDIYCHGRVIYSLEQQKALIRHLLLEEFPSRTGMSFPELMENEVRSTGDTEAFRSLRRRLRKALNIYAMFFKQEEFAAENEYRIVFRNPDRSRIQFREKEGFLLPYIDIDLAQKGELMPISSVTVAPKNHVDLARKGMVQYLEHLGYAVPVELSRLKLRY